MKKYICALALTLLSLVGPANAEIYKFVDANGVVTFSDKPPEGAQETFEPIPSPAQINSMQSLPIAPPEPLASIEEKERDGDEAERKISILSPADNSTIPMGAGIFDVLVNAEPALIEGESLELYLDGVKVGEGQTAPKWTLTYVIRGAHKIQVKWRAEDGSLLAVSDPVTVFVLRPSIL